MAKSKVEYKPSLGSVLTLGAELVSSRVTCTGGDRGVCVWGGPMGTHICCECKRLAAPTGSQCFLCDNGLFVWAILSTTIRLQHLNIWLCACVCERLCGPRRIVSGEWKQVAVAIEFPCSKTSRPSFYPIAFFGRMRLSWVGECGCSYLSTSVLQSRLFSFSCGKHIMLVAKSSRQSL